MSSIRTTDEKFHELHVLCDTKAKVVKISKEDLLNLLMDHSALIKHESKT